MIPQQADAIFISLPWIEVSAFGHSALAPSLSSPFCWSLIAGSAVRRHLAPAGRKGFSTSLPQWVRMGRHMVGSRSG